MQSKEKNIIYVFAFLAFSFLFTHPAIVYGQSADEIKARITQLNVQRDNAMKAKKYAVAYAALQEIVRLNPRHARSYYHMAIIHFMRNEHKQGLPFLEKAIVLLPDNLTVRLAYARALRELALDDKAIDEYQYLLGKLKKESAPYLDVEKQLAFLLIKKAIAEKNAKGVVEVSEQLVNRFPNDSAILYRVGSIYLDFKNYLKAEAVFKQLEVLAPTNPTPHFYLGNIYEATNRLEQAEQQFKVVLDLSPGLEMEEVARVKYRTVVGLRYLHSDDIALAMQEFEAVVELKPTHVVANMNLGLLYLERDELSKAARAFEAVIAQQSAEVGARLRLATIYLDTGKPIDGVRELDFIVNTAPGSAYEKSAKDILMRLEAKIGKERLVSMREVIAAVVEMEEGVEDNPQDLKTRFELADLWVRSGKKIKALNEFKSIVELDSSHVDARIRLAALLEEKKDYDGAKMHYDEAANLLSAGERLDLVNLRRLTVYSKNLISQKKYDLAEPVLQEILLLKEKNFSALWGMASIAAAQGRLEDAISWYEVMLRHYPDALSVRGNIARLYERISEEEKALPHYGWVVQSIDADERRKKAAQARIDHINRQINGLSYSVGYSLALDDNSRLSEDERSFDYRSDTSGRISYNYKIRKGLKFNLTVRPMYQIYHVGQYDFLNISFYPSLAMNYKGVKYSLGVQRSNQYGVLRSDGSVTRTDTLIGNGTWTVDDNTTYQANLSYLTFASDINPFFDANTLSGGVTLYKRKPNGVSYNYGYRLVKKINNNELGSDYAYVGNSLSAGVNKRFSPKLSGSASARLGLDIYDNNDSISNHRFRRKNLLTSLTIGANYRFNDRYSFFSNATFVKQNSSLPVGIILDQLQVIELSTSIGSYIRNQISLGMRISL